MGALETPCLSRYTSLIVIVISHLPKIFTCEQFCHTPRICNLILLLISWACLFIESNVSDTDNVVPFENTSPINQNKMVNMRKAEQIDRSGIFEWVQCCQCRINLIQ